jgi:hypothetical protein
LLIQGVLRLPVLWLCILRLRIPSLAIASLPVSSLSIPSLPISRLSVSRLLTHPIRRLRNPWLRVGLCRVRLLAVTVLRALNVLPCRLPNRWIIRRPILHRALLRK